MTHLLSWIVFLPLAGSLACLLTPKSNTHAFKKIATFATGLDLVLGLVLFFQQK